MRKIAIKLLLTLLAVSLLNGGLSLAQPANAPPGDTSNATVPSGFNEPPSGTEAGKGGEGQPKKHELQRAGTVTIDGVNYYLTTKTPYEYDLALITVGIGIATMVMVVASFYGHIAEKTDDFVKLFAFVVVVFSAVFLITVGYSDTQTAPVYSLLGTIIGYIFGRDVTMRQHAGEGAAKPPPAPAQHAPAPSPTVPAGTEPKTP
ncbi:MAG: hypothetical protein P8Y53_23545 [Pseudolabrys sp.]